MSGFDLLDRPLVFIPVTWPGVVADEAGDAKAVMHRVKLQVEILDNAEMTAWIEGSATVPEGVERDAHNIASFRRVVKGWREIKANGRVPEFNDANIGRLLEWPGFNEAMGDAYLDAWRGRVATREGNSEGSPANGPAVEPTDETSKAATSSS